MTARIDREAISEPLDALRNSPFCAGVSIGSCVAGGRFRAKAHSHLRDGDRFKGWVCFLSNRWVENWSLVLHELAHLITEHGHDDTWRACLLSLGGTLKETAALKNYEKRAP